MSEKHVLIIGGGLAGLSAGCYARASGFDATIVEHNLALGGVCTAWSRGAYTVDGCIHWLTGGPFLRLYEELGILPAVELATIEHFCTYRHAREHLEVSVTRNLDDLARHLERLAPSDRDEIRRIVAGARDVAELDPGFSHPHELSTRRESIASLWQMRHEAGTLVHFRKPLRTYLEHHVKSPRLARFLSHVGPVDAPALFTLMMLGYLERGFLSRPLGGTAAFRDALIATWERLGGRTRLHTTVDEILVRDGRAAGVRLGDGEMLQADVVISTSSAPETVLRLLGGRYAAAATRDRLERWKLFDPIVLASYGAQSALAGEPPMLSIDGIERFEVGEHPNDALYVRICNDDPALAPAGHSVVQVLAPTRYDWWATRGSRYGAAKDEVAELLLDKLEPQLPGLRDAVRMTDVATPLTYWNMARSWRGAYEGWIPSENDAFSHVAKTLPGLDGFYMAGQWVEPGGGVPTAILSGRQVIQIACHDDGRSFAIP